MDQAWLCILFGKKVLEGGMISVDNNLGTHQVRSEFLDSKDYNKKFLLCSGVIQCGPLKVLLA